MSNRVDLLSSLHNPIGARKDLTLYCITTPNVNSHVELLVTPYERQTWADLWEICLATRDQPGALARAANVLAELGVHVLRRTTVTSGRTHLMHFAVDCRGYSSVLDGDLHTRVWRQRLEELQFHLEVQLIDLIDFVGAAPSVHIRRNHLLWNVHHDVMHKKRVMDGGYALRWRGRLAHFPEATLNAVRRELAVRNQVEPTLLRTPVLLRSYDESGDVCRIFFSFEELGTISVRVWLKPDPGAGAALAELLAANGYDAISTTLEGRDNETVTWMLLRDLRSAIPAVQTSLHDRLSAVLSREGGLEPHQFEVEPTQLFQEVRHAYRNWPANGHPRGPGAPEFQRS